MKSIGTSPINEIRLIWLTLRGKTEATQGYHIALDSWNAAYKHVQKFRTFAQEVYKDFKSETTKLWIFTVNFELLCFSAPVNFKTTDCRMSRAEMGLLNVRVPLWGCYHWIRFDMCASNLFQIHTRKELFLERSVPSINFFEWYFRSWHRWHAYWWGSHPILHAKRPLLLVHMKWIPVSAMVFPRGSFAIAMWVSLLIFEVLTYLNGNQNDLCDYGCSDFARLTNHFAPL